jgi:4'-phosphopantetheinyl transferase
MPVPEISWQSFDRAHVLTGDEVHVLAFALNATPERISHLATELSEDEMVRANQFRFGHLRDRFIVGRAGLRIVLARYLGMSPSGLQFNYSARGKPSLAGNNLQFNLAHSDELALLAVAKNLPVGVDVERIRPMPDGLDIARRFFAASEVAAFGDIPPSAHDEAFFNLWTRKEAWLKATGDGIAESLSKVEFTFRPGEPARVVAIDGDPREASEWSLNSLQPAIGFVGAIALRGQGIMLKCLRASL